MMMKTLADLPRVGELLVLKSKPRHEQALSLLKKVEEEITPLMKKRHWKVDQIREFFPKDERLLGLNERTGHRIVISIRLRRPRNEANFFSFDHVLGTALHELVHIECGPHDSSFYRLLNELTREWEDLAVARVTTQNSSSSSSSFQGGSYRLGGGSGLGLDLNFSQTKELFSPREMAAFAAERRNSDNQMCDTTKFSLTPSLLLHCKSSLSSSPFSPSLHDSLPLLQGYHQLSHTFSSQTSKGKKWTRDELGISEEDALAIALAESLYSPPYSPILPSHSSSPSSQPSSDPSSVVSRPPFSFSSSSSPSSSLLKRDILATATEEGETLLKRRRKDQMSSMSSPSVKLEEQVRRTGGEREGESEGWSCHFCTLRNKATALRCDACTSARIRRNGGKREGSVVVIPDYEDPSASSSSSSSAPSYASSSTSLRKGIVACSVCTLENEPSKKNCDACNSPLPFPSSR